MFAITIERQLRANTQEILGTPPVVGVLSYCAQFKDEMPWYTHHQRQVAESGGKLTYQKTPLIRRLVLVTFLRQADPSAKYERPCANLDREPRQGEPMIRCVAHRLSEEKFGPGKGFRCRELLYNDQQIKINAALASKRGDPTVYLSKIPEICYMCHVWLTTEMALNHRNATADANRRDLTAPEGSAAAAAVADAQQPRMINRFMVDVDKPGEYSRRMMIGSGKNYTMGIWGPFPLWNEKNYIAVKLADSGLYGFEETDNLLFRPAREPSQVTENASILCTPTPAKQAGLNLLQ